MSAGLTTLASLAALVIILRVLPAAEAGRFAFLVELIYAFGRVGSLGQATLQARLYHQSPAKRWNWSADVRSTVCFTAPVIIVAAGVAVVPFRLSLVEIVCLAVGAELFVVTNCFSLVLAQQRSYAWSSALLRLPNALMLLPALVTLGFGLSFSLDLLLASFLGFLALTAGAGAVLLARTIESGSAQINLRERFAGLIFVVSVIAIVVPQRGLIVVSGALLDNHSVAALAALLGLLRVYDLIGDPAGRVFATEGARHPDALGRSLFVAPWLLAAAVSLPLFAAMPPLVRQFYAGRYDSALPLLPWLLLAGALRLVETVPRGLLGYTAPQSLLNRYGTVQVVIALLGLAVMVKLGHDYGISGIAWSAPVIAAARLGCSYFFLQRLTVHAQSSGDPRERLVVKRFEASGQESPI